jgi:excisionase family DNA binding protein
MELTSKPSTRSTEGHAPASDALRRVRDRGPHVTGTARLEDAYLSLIALAEYSGLSVRTLRGYLAHPMHPLPHYRPGGKVLVKRSEFDAWMAAFKSTLVSTVDGLVDEVFRGL